MRRVLIAAGCLMGLWACPSWATEGSSGQYVGIGIKFAIRDGGAYVTKTLDGSPAQQAGIQAGDQITAIDDVPVSRSADDGALAKSLRGEEGTTVGVTVKRPGTPEPVRVRLRRVSILCPTYSNRYVSGTLVQIGQFKGLEVRLAAQKAGDLQITLYVVNESDQPVTFDPEQVAVNAVREQNGILRRTKVRTYSADAYERKVQNDLAWRGFLVAMGNVQVPQPETYSISGNANTSAYDWRSGTSASARSNYSTTITRQPTLSEQQDAQDRAAARTERAMAPARAAAEAATSGLMRIQTVDPHTSYGGIVFVKAKGDDYTVTVPFGTTDFDFSMSFEH